ncbi:peptide/nickel transport system permease protein [Paenibacillus sp. UNCCL117]|uniref:ABC transporter permease n=1 Tax=unclassified Paenibacillus TaxID=185978 RepID=UPI0008868CD5|nr:MULTISPECIES: ABC transporter permease [unclassified Paenibacillus]SDE28503.1 peptide/nickel transport system permease protein [Paenibacillus sp. cl123]SFW63466.1 peptide/nickel transport system permease protein [Paenibacillus sp. UNCCL117]
MLLHSVSTETVLPGSVRRKNKPRVRVAPIAFSKIYLSLSVSLLAFLLACAIAPGWIAPYEPTDMMTDKLLQAPSMAHWLGTDQFGRDIWSLVIYGSRQSLAMGIVSAVIGGVAGTVIGLIAGYWGGVVDSIFMRLNDILMTIPGILLAIAISVALGPSFFNVILAISIATIPSKARVIRSQVMTIRSRPFIDAARSVGTSHLEIMLRHILPNCYSPLLVMVTIGVGSSILVGTGLSFLGLGVVQEIPDWGYMLSQGRNYMTVAWWVAAFPGLAITLLVVAVNLLGDEIRDKLDPKTAAR